ncbi:P-loop containing nucleoside triphosphate hydrolase protein, partial [Dimargaris cristalligena]
SRVYASSQYLFTRVFGNQITQQSLFQSTTLPVIQEFFDGYNTLIFAYGVTNSGKTYTIQGTRDQPGIIPRALNIILHHIKDAQSEFEYAIWVSYAEIYNEFIYDLLDLKTLVTGSMPPARLNMKIRTDVDDGHYLEGITEIRIRTLEDALAVLAHGQKHRTANSTLLNQESSRSHSIFTVKLLRIRRQMSVGADTCIEPHMVQVQKMSIVDLAGSERAAKTQNTGDRLHEAGMINKSLMVLGNCLETLRFNQFKSDKMRPQMVPFRESQLTKLFQSSFMGGAKTVMLVNVNPYDDSYEETRRVLKFAAVAKDVTTVNTPIASTPLYRAVLHSKPPLNSILTSPSLGPSSNTRCSTPAGPGSEARLSLLNTPEPPLLPDGGLSDCDEPHINPGFTFTFDALNELKEQYTEAQYRCAQIEFDVRQELSQEYNRKILEMEERYNQRLQDEVMLNEEKCKSKIDILTRS